MNPYILFSLLTATTSVSFILLYFIGRIETELKILLWLLWAIDISAGAGLWAYAIFNWGWLQHHSWVIYAVAIATIFTFGDAVDSRFRPKTKRSMLKSRSASTSE